MKDLLLALAIATGLCATGAMADESTRVTQEEAPIKTVKKKKKTKKKKKSTVHKSHKAHKFHEDHKVAQVETPPPAPEPPAPPPEPVVATPPPVVHVEKKDDSGFYIGGGLGSFDLSVTGLNVNGAGGRARVKDSEFGGYGNVGYNFNRNIAVELRAGGVDTVSRTLEGGPLLGTAASVPFVFFADTDSFWSAFLKGTIPLSDDFGFYGLLGATHAIVDVAANIGPIAYREDYNSGDLSYGVGIEGRVGKSLKLGAEWVKYIDDSDGGVAVDLDGLVGRVQFQF